MFVFPMFQTINRVSWKTMATGLTSFFPWTLQLLLRLAYIYLESILSRFRKPALRLLKQSFLTVANLLIVDHGVPIQVEVIHHNNSTRNSNETLQDVGKQIVSNFLPKCQSSGKQGPFVSNGREWETGGSGLTTNQSSGWGVASVGGNSGLERQRERE